MKAEIISIGSELTSGQNLDTNSQWLSRRLGEIGVDVRWHTTLADDLEENVQAFSVARDRAGLVVITGGLGPTQDDLTREALAKLAGVELVFHQPSLERIQEMFARRRRAMPAGNRVQALFPAGAEPLPNALGTAPGSWMILGEGEAPAGLLLLGSAGASPSRNTFVVAMPGVPSEMHAMFEEQVKPRLVKLGLGAGVIVQRKINCFGAGESAIEQKLLDLTRRGHVPDVGITVSDATVSLRILARAADVEAARGQIEPVERVIRERLGEMVFGVEEEELQHAVARLLRERRLTLAVAEGVTGGLLSRRLTQVPGVSRQFVGGIIAYDSRSKVEQLGVPQQLIDEHGAVSAPVAEAMAIACRIRFRSDLALSTVGLAGPTGGSPDKPVGLVFAALAWKDGVKSQSFSWVGTRQDIQSRTAKLGLNLLRLKLLE